MAGRRAARHGGVAVAVAAALAAMAWYVQRSARDADRREPPRGRFVDVDGARLHYVERGSGPVVVLLHGNGSRIEEVEASGLAERLARDHRVIAFDRPGFGHSSRPLERDWDVAAQAQAFAQALEALRVERATLVGHSWSTLVAIAMALDHPERVGGLVLASGYYFPTFRPDFLFPSIATWPVIGALMRHTTTPVASRLLWPLSLRLVFRPNPPGERMRSIDPWAFLRPHSLRSQSQEAGWLVEEAARLSRRYADVRVPTAILCGDEDRFVPPQRHGERLYRAIDGSSLQRLRGAGHMLHHDDPGAVARAVADVEARALRGKGASRALVPDAAALLPDVDASLGHAD